MREFPGTSGLVLNEPLAWEKGAQDRCGISLPVGDVEASDPDDDLIGEVPAFPGLSEVDLVRHYTRLSQWNFGVDSGMYPLGSCTMKYNPKINEQLAALPGFARAHPLLPPELKQGLPLVAMRLLLANVKDCFENIAKTTGCLQELDNAYGFIESELDLIPRVELFARRSFDLAPKARDAGDITALYRLLAIRIISTLRQLPSSSEKYVTMTAIKELAGTFDLDALEHAFKKKVMTLKE